MNRDFIISRRWRLPNSSDTGPNTEGPVNAAQQFNPTITMDTKLRRALDQVLGDSSGDIRNNSRDPDSFAAILNPSFTETVDSSESVDGKRLLPFEVSGGSIDGGPAFISGYNAYINDLADSFVMRNREDSTLTASALKVWAEKLREKTDDLSRFTRNLLMIGNVSGTGTAMDAIVSNHMLFRECCLSLCKFLHTSNKIETPLRHDGSSSLIDGKYAVPYGFFPRRYEQLIQLAIIKTCMEDETNEGFSRLEAYLRYRREALQIRSDLDGDGPQWPDLGDFKNDPGAAGTSGKASRGADGLEGAYNFGSGGDPGTGGTEASYTDWIEEYGGHTGGPDVEARGGDAGVAFLDYDDATFWWEDYYASFANTYPRFVQAASDLAYYFCEQEEGTGILSNTRRCVTARLKLKSQGQSVTRYGLMQSPIGAALIQAHGEKQVSGGGDDNRSVFDFIINIWDDYEESIFTMAKNIEDHGTGDFSSSTDFAQGAQDDYVQNTDTWYRGISRDTSRMMTYFMACQLIRKFLPVESIIEFGNDVSIEDFSVQITDDTGYSYAQRTGGQGRKSSHGYIGAEYHEDEDWQFQDGFNVSIYHPFDMHSKFYWDPTKGPSFLISCLDAFGSAFGSDIDSVYNSTLNPQQVYANTKYGDFIKDIGKKWRITAPIPDAPSTHGLYDIYDRSSDTNFNFADPDYWTQAHTGIPGIVASLVTEDMHIIQIVNTMRHIGEILNDHLALGQGTETTSEPLSTYSSEYLSLMRRYMYGTKSDGTPNLSEGDIDLDDSDANKTDLKAIFDSMNPDAVATAYCILSDNFTLSTAYINCLNAIPTPMMGLMDASFPDGGATNKYANLFPASEAINEVNYALIRWFQSGAKNRLPPGAAEERGGQAKKILAIGIPVGMLQNLREQAMKDEFIYREKAFTTSNFVNSSLIRIRVIKKSHDNPNVVFTPRTFYFDARLFYCNSDIPVDPTSLLPSSASPDSAVSDNRKSLSDLYSEAGKNCVGVYSFSTDGSTLGTEELKSIRLKNTISPSQATNLGNALNKLAVQPNGTESGGTGMGILTSQLGSIGALESCGVKLRRFELGLTTNMTSTGRNPDLNFFDYDIDRLSLNQAGAQIEAIYDNAINGSTDAPASETDPTSDFLGTNETGDSGETIHGVGGDPWAYDQLTGEHYTEAMLSTYKFGKQVAANEFYSGILKNYLKMMTGFDVSERAFMMKTLYGDVGASSPILPTPSQNDRFLTHRPSTSFGDTNLYSNSISVEGSSIDTIGAPISAAKASLVGRIVQYMSTANPAVSDLELRSIQTMFLRSLPMSSDKFRNQGLLPKLFDRTFCIAIDAENDFHGYNTYEGDDTFDSYDSEPAELIGATSYEASDGVIYSFLVDVGIVPQDEGQAGMRSANSGESIMTTDDE